MKLKMDYKWVALSVTNIGTFMGTLDSSIVIIGLPTILQNLHANIDDRVTSLRFISNRRTADYLPVPAGRRCGVAHLK